MKNSPALPSENRVSFLPEEYKSHLSLQPETSPDQELRQKQLALSYLQEGLEERELHVAHLPVINWKKLGRKLGHIFRYHRKKLQPKEVAKISCEEAKAQHWERQISATEKKLRLSTARYHRLESILLTPPFFSLEVLHSKLRHFFNSPVLMVSTFFYHRFVKRRKNRLGILEQHAPIAPASEKFPRPTLASADLPSISIVTPSYNQAPFLEQTIRSVLDQNYPRLQYHVQDGNSRDGSTAILQQFAEKLTWESAPDKGQSDAIIKGFARTGGDVMAWLNSDDFITPGSLRFVGEYFALNPEVDVIYGHRVIVNETGQEIGRWFLPSHDRESLRWADFIPQETLFWRRSAWEKVKGVDPSFHFAMDWDFLLRLQNSDLVIRRLPYFIGCFRVHTAQKTSSIINSTGLREMEALRSREHGRHVSQRVVDHHIRPLFIRSAFCALAWRFGIRL